jgi:hypothetical protein
MPAVIREDQIPAAIESLRGYMAACEPISMDPVGFTAEEISAIQKMRIDKAKVALENIGIQVSQALASLQAVANPERAEPWNPIEQFDYGSRGRNHYQEAQ